MGIQKFVTALAGFSTGYSYAELRSGETECKQGGSYLYAGCYQVLQGNMIQAIVGQIGASAVPQPFRTALRLLPYAIFVLTPLAGALRQGMVPTVDKVIEWFQPHFQKRLPCIYSCAVYLGSYCPKQLSLRMVRGINL
ncbi:MAG TPA: hypothetical protein VFU89_02215, partial [Rhabdochlamydiaceae bacterium]|nr:hypothetical protein [Rhabdochlamydiaceae bacterium]